MLISSKACPLIIVMMKLSCVSKSIQNRTFAAVLLVVGSINADNKRIFSENKLGVIRDGLAPRIFGISLYDKQLVSIHEKSGASQWYLHPTNPWSPRSDVSALSWYNSGYLRRVFGISNSGELIVYQEDDSNAGNSIVQYLNTVQFSLSGTFEENVTALDLGDASHTRVLGVRHKSTSSGVNSERLLMLKGNGTGGAIADSYNLYASSWGKLRAWSSIAGARLGPKSALWGVSANSGIVMLCESGSGAFYEYIVASSSEPASSIAATSYSYNGDNYAALVYFNRISSDFRLLVWKNNFDSAFPWKEINLGQISGGIKDEKNALAIAVHPAGLEIVTISANSSELWFKNTNFLGDSMTPWGIRGKSTDSGSIRSISLISDPTPRTPNSTPPGLSLTTAVFSKSWPQDWPLGYIFEERSEDAIILDASTSLRKMRNHLDHGATKGVVNPVVSIGAQRIRRAWTESFVAEKEGIMIAAAMVPPLDTTTVLPSEHMNVEAAFSSNDGHSWDYLTVPKAFDTNSGLGITQGDPTTAVDDDGNAYVMIHEVSTSPSCNTTPDRLASYVHVFRKSPTSNFLSWDSSLSKLNNPWYLEDSNRDAYLDHPQMVATGRDLHFTWLVESQNEEIRKIFYRSKVGNNYSSPIIVSNDGAANGAPYMIADRNSNIFIYWQNSQGTIYFCDTRTINSTGCVKKNVTNDINVQTYAHKYYANIEGISFRSGHIQFARGASDGHIVGVWVACAAHVGDGSQEECPTTNRHIVFTQSYDAGVTWSPIEKLTSFSYRENYDAFDPTVFVQKDGGVVVSYWSNKGMVNKKQVKRVFHVKKPNSVSWEYVERDSDVMDVSMLSKRCGGGDVRFNGDYHIGVGGDTRGHFLWSASKSVNNIPDHQLNISTISWSTWR